MKKRYLAVFIALIIVLFSMPVLAAGTGTLTIDNATTGKAYSLYKIFDLTHSGDAYAYSIGSSDPWYDEVNEAASPFVLTKIETSADRYNVSIGDEEAAFNWLKAKAATIKDGSLAIAADATQTADSSSLEFKNLAYGYYFVTSELGSVVTISNVAKNVQIIDKNQAAGLTGKEVSSSGDDASWAASNSAGIGDTVHFKIEAFVPMYNGPKAVFEYVFTDNLGPGLTLDQESIVVKLGGATISKIRDYKISFDDQNMTIIIKPYGYLTYPDDTNVVITYSAMVNENAVYANTNSAAMSWTEFDPDKDPYDQDNLTTATEDDPPPAVTTTYVYGFELKKYKEEVDNANLLEGAEFRLYNTEASVQEIKVVETAEGQYRLALSSENGVAINAGAAKIFGLAAGTYWLEETRAPDGYNQLTARVKIELTDANSTDGYLTAGVDIVNKAGITLPATGGIGIYIFYIAGSALMLAALVVFLKKTRPAPSKKVR